MQQVRSLPKNFCRCSECKAAIAPGHIVVVFATTLIWPEGTSGPFDIRHRCKDCNGSDRWESKFEARYPGMWSNATMTVTSADGDVPEDL